jgi:hypothetical protein
VRESEAIGAGLITVRNQVFLHPFAQARPLLVKILLL